MTKQVIQPRDYTGMASSIKGTIVDLEVELEDTEDVSARYQLQHRLASLGNLLKALQTGKHD